MPTHKSQHFNTRAADSDIRFVILHYTETADSTETFHLFETREVSAHYVIDTDGALWDVVAEDKRAWHAGESYWGGISDINSYSIGIELQNSGTADYPQAQISALLLLLKDITARHAIKQGGILGHSDIAPSRKQDPGILFPWDLLAREGFGYFPDGAGDSKAAELPDLLRSIGYGNCDEADSIAAFQRHYRPSLINGVADDECASLARSLLDLLIK